MSKVAVFLPTCHAGGLDVFEASIKRQTVQPDVIYVADTLERVDVWHQVGQSINRYINLLYPPWNIDDVRNLAKAYNEAAFNSVRARCDLFISLQDYIWIPEDGIERFVYVHEKDPTALITGITHISKDPLPEEIKDINADYSIFKEAFWEKPKEIDWHDVRATDIYNTEAGNIYYVYPEHWEANWSAVPVDMFRRGIKWDSAFDQGIAYENIAFAKDCVKETNCNVLMDIDNVAISLPHKKYWPQEVEDIIKYSNKWLYDSLYG